MLHCITDYHSIRVNIPQTMYYEWIFMMAQAEFGPGHSNRARRGAQAKVKWRGAAQSEATGFVSVPRRSTVTLTESPGLRKTGGLRKTPTPGGVPVEIKSPGSQVTDCER